MRGFFVWLMRVITIIVCLIGLCLSGSILLLWNFLFLGYLIIEEILFLLSGKTWRLPEKFLEFFIYPQGFVLEIVYLSCKGLVGKPFK